MEHVQANIEAAKVAMAAIERHPMALHVRKDATHLTVLYPRGFRLDGVRVTLANGVKWAAEQALMRMEREWVESAPGWRA